MIADVMRSEGNGSTGVDACRICIRNAQIDDVIDIARIWRIGLAAALGLEGPTSDAAVAAFSARITSPLGKSQFWVAAAHGRVVGWQSLTDFGVTQISPIAQSSTYVDTDWQSRGVGRLLLIYAQQQAVTIGLQTIVGWIRTDNHPSVRMVSSLGWQLVGVLPREATDVPELAYWAYSVPKKAGIE
jgi:L-amino acid N-acyltransferase YncA